MSIWKKVRLSDISTSMYGYTASASTEAVGPKFLRITDIQDRVINWDSVPYCAISEKEYEKYKLYKNDIVVARTGNSTGTNAIIKEDIDAVFASYLIRFRVNEKIADPYFVASVLSSKSFTEFVNQVAGGSAQKGANANILGTFEVSLPPLGVQQRIASIIRLFDDKIELNRRINETLEQMAMALYKHWFVDFGPFQDGEFVECEIGMIPKGWEIGNLGDVYFTSSGGTPKRNVKEYYEGGTINWLKTKELDDGFIFSTEEKLTESGLQNSSAKIFPENSVVMAMYGATVGKLGILGCSSSTNQACCAIIPQNDEFGYEYIFLYLLYNRPNIIKLANGGAQQNISQQIIKELKILLPPLHVMKDINSNFKWLFYLIKENQRENIYLKETRDYLLPRLLSGEIEVREAEEQVEEVLANA